jgi:tRNA modification GTPase
LATPIGRSGIGVIRLSGTQALTIASKMSEARLSFNHDMRISSTLPTPKPPKPIDAAVLTYFQTPNSFTGEDVVEISCHGSPVLLRHVIDICLREGARMADPGEFTLRAVAKGKMDLSEAEAIRDLIDAQTTGVRSASCTTDARRVLASTSTDQRRTAGCDRGA